MKSDNNLLALVCTTFDAHCAALFLPEAESEDVHVLTSVATSASPEPWSELKIVPGKGLAGWIVRHKQAVIVNDLHLRPSFLGYYSEDDESLITNFMGCPLPQAGILCVDSIRNRSFSAADQALLYKFATHLSKEDRSASLSYLCGELGRYLTCLEKLTSLHAPWRKFLGEFLLSLAEASGFSYVAMVSLADKEQYLVEGETRKLVQGEHLSLAGGGLVSWVLRNEVPVYESSSGGATLFGAQPKLNSPVFQSIVCLPIFVEQDICGVLCLADEQPKALSPNLREFVRTAGYLLSTRLELITLRHRCQKAIGQSGKLYTDGAFAFNPDADLDSKLDKD